MGVHVEKCMIVDKTEALVILLFRDGDITTDDIEVKINLPTFLQGGKYKRRNVTRKKDFSCIRTGWITYVTERHMKFQTHQWN